MSRGDKVLAGLFGVTFVAYALFFAHCFSELPIRVSSPLQQFLLICSHFIPMLLLELLLCRVAKPLWQFLLPALLLLVPGLVCMAVAQWDLRALYLVLLWWAAPFLGWFLARLWSCRDGEEKKTL